MTALWHDIRYGVRMLRKSPGLTVIALITLAVAIGANAVMFSISDMLLFLRPRKVKGPEQLAFCGIKDAQFPWFRYSEYQTLRDCGAAFGGVLAQGVIPGPVTMVHEGSARQVQASYVSANYFAVLGATPARGRGFLPEEDQAGVAPAVILSHRCWRRLGGDPTLVGGFAWINGARCQIVGVAPEDFTGVTLTGSDVWLSLGSYRAVDTFARQRPDREYPWLHLVGRLKPGLTMAVAQAQLQALDLRLSPQDREDWRGRSSFELRPPGRFEVGGDYRQVRLVMTLFSLVLMSASAIVLGIACLNLASMLIVHGTSRHREIAVRLALGGGRWRIVRQLLIESGLLALTGGVFGVLLAFLGTWVLNTWIGAVQEAELRSLQPHLNVRVLAATLGVSLAASLLFGLRPALRLSTRDIAGEIKGAAGRVPGFLRRKRGGFSVTSQTALAVVLTLCAALLTRSALELARPDPRYCLEDKLVVQIDPEAVGYDWRRSLQAYEALADHLTSLPQVKALGTSPRLLCGDTPHAAIGEYVPGSGANEPGRTLAKRGALAFVGRDYFKAMEIPLLRGRCFDRLDSVPGAEKVAVIDESLAQKLRPDGNALDCLIQWGLFTKADSEPHRVVGIVANVPGIGDQEVCPQMYTPADANSLSPYLYLHVANAGSMDPMCGRIVEEIRRFDPQIPVLSVTTLAQRRHANSSIWLARFGARLAMAAGAAALFLAALGIYAIKGYRVASRTPEIGIRKALGATHASIMGMVLREGLTLTAAGLAVGLAMGLAVARVAASLLYGVSPLDPVSIVATVALLGAASLLASYIPARRAAKVDPMVALRCE